MFLNNKSVEVGGGYWWKVEESGDGMEESVLYIYCMIFIIWDQRNNSNQ